MVGGFRRRIVCGLDAVVNGHWRSVVELHLTRGDDHFALLHAAEYGDLVAAPCPRGDEGLPYRLRCGILLDDVDRAAIGVIGDSCLRQGDVAPPFTVISASETFARFSASS